ncbi:hypothetical protein TEA_028298 [Camellia sinensis var. sinensis]|uniref:Uncharacterized protein n=1 Tax=Camellia sinensis var. sinensis TaxID=542762 RepID=A0A4S4DRE5_CAMSN|nr:hypothetical protein TEA_028298 [Camellia sinensis var. sinensis]
MDSIRVLVLNTKEAELEICHYAKEGNVVELAVLLMIAREEVALLMSQIRDGSTSNGCISIHQYILSKLEALICEEYKPTSYNEQKKLLLAGKEKKAAFISVLVLLEFFEMEGDTIEAYIRQERVNLSKEQVALAIAWLLQGAKILPKYRGINLNKIWSRPERRLGFMQPTRYAIRAKELVKKKLKDGEMNDNTKYFSSRWVSRDLRNQSQKRQRQLSLLVLAKSASCMHLKVRKIPIGMFCLPFTAGKMTFKRRYMYEKRL